MPHAFAALIWILVLGDSLVTGFPYTHGTAWPVRTRVLRVGSGLGVDVYGVAGERLDQVGARYTAQHRNKRHTHVAIFAGTNDILQDATAATAYSRMRVVADAAIADGQKLVLFTVPPFGTYVSSSAGRQTQRTAYNNLLIAAVQAGGDYAGATLIRLDTLLADSTTPANLATAYNSGDGLHWSSAGEDVVASAVSAALP